MVQKRLYRQPASPTEAKQNPTFPVYPETILHQKLTPKRQGKSFFYVGNLYGCYAFKRIHHFYALFPFSLPSSLFSPPLYPIYPFYPLVESRLFLSALSAYKVRLPNPPPPPFESYTPTSAVTCLWFETFNRLSIWLCSTHTIV